MRRKDTASVKRAHILSNHASMCVIVSSRYAGSNRPAFGSGTEEARSAGGSSEDCGPVFPLSTSTEDFLGAQKFGMDPTAQIGSERHAGGTTMCFTSAM
jgi:hypothetical protein